MAAIIRFADGFEAKLLDESGKWECADEEAKEILEMWSEMFEYEGIYDPNEVRGMAYFVAERVGAEVVHVDPLDYGDDPPDTIY